MINWQVDNGVTYVDRIELHYGDNETSHPVDLADFNSRVSAVTNSVKTLSKVGDDPTDLSAFLPSSPDLPFLIYEELYDGGVGTTASWAAEGKIRSGDKNDRSGLDQPLKRWTGKFAVDTNGDLVGHNDNTGLIRFPKDWVSFDFELLHSEFLDAASLITIDLVDTATANNDVFFTLQLNGDRWRIKFPGGEDVWYEWSAQFFSVARPIAELTIKDKLIQAFIGAAKELPAKLPANAALIIADDAVSDARNPPLLITFHGIHDQLNKRQTKCPEVKLCSAAWPHMPQAWKTTAITTDGFFPAVQPTGPQTLGSGCGSSGTWSNYPTDVIPMDRALVVNGAYIFYQSTNTGLVSYTQDIVFSQIAGLLSVGWSITGRDNVDPTSRRLTLDTGLTIAYFLNSLTVTDVIDVNGLSGAVTNFFIDPATGQQTSGTQNLPQTSSFKSVVFDSALIEIAGPEIVVEDFDPMSSYSLDFNLGDLLNANQLSWPNAFDGDRSSVGIAIDPTAFGATITNHRPLA